MKIANLHDVYRAAYETGIPALEISEVFGVPNMLTFELELMFEEAVQTRDLGMLFDVLDSAPTDSILEEKILSAILEFAQRTGRIELMYKVHNLSTGASKFAAVRAIVEALQ